MSTARLVLSIIIGGLIGTAVAVAFVAMYPPHEWTRIPVVAPEPMHWEGKYLIRDRDGLLLESIQEFSGGRCGVYPKIYATCEHAKAAAEKAHR